MAVNYKDLDEALSMIGANKRQKAFAVVQRGQERKVKLELKKALN